MLEKKTFTGLMDGDTEARLLPPNVYRYALNVRSGSADADNIGAIETVAGNTLVLVSLPTGVINKVIGAYEDSLNSKIYYFLYNSSQQHSIFEYNFATNVIVRVLQNAILNFSLTHLITGVNVLEGQLLFTDDFNEPRNIDIEKAKGNLYPSPLLDENINAIRMPPNVAPTVEYTTDSNLKFNYLKGNFLQFKYKYHYKNKQRSAWSPISTLPFSININNNGLTVDELLYLDNAISVEVSTGTELVERIEISARLGNVGDFFSIITLDKFKLSISSNTTHTYTFINDGNYNTVEINESIKLFDRVPRKAKAQEIVNGERINYGNIVEDFDVPIIATSLSTTYRPTQSYTIRGFLAIKNMFSSEVPYNDFQPIWQESIGGVATSVFGGYGSAKVVSNVGVDFKQDIPLGGFTLYLAGTDNFGTSKQNVFNAGYQSANQNSFVFGTPSSVINSFVTTAPTNPSTSPFSNSQCFHSFEIPNVVDGTYVMRVASHQINPGNLNDRSYQRTSTNVLQIAGENGTEVKITIDSVNNTATIGDANPVTFQIPANGIIDLTDLTNIANRNLVTYIADLTNPNYNSTFATNSSCLSGYVAEGLDPLLMSGDASFTPTIDLALVKISIIDSFGNKYNPIGNQWNNNQVIFEQTKGWKTYYPGQSIADFYVFTDHNGYFFFAVGNKITIGNSKLEVTGITVGQLDIPLSIGFYQARSYVLLNSNATTITYSSSSSDINVLGFFSSSNASLLATSKTLLLGRIVDAFGNPRQYIQVIAGRGKIAVSDFFGRYAQYVFVDTKITLYGGGTVRKDNIYYAVYGTKYVDFAISNDVFDISISGGAFVPSFTSPYSGNYNYVPTNSPPSGSASGNIVILPDLVSVPSSVNGNIRALKRGFTGQFGIVYYDGNGNRSSSTLTEDSLKIKIPFYTEKENGVQHVGRPVVTWSIYNEPPDWAVKYQWVRTKNETIDRYLQYVAKDIAFVNNSGAHVPQANATIISLSLNNLQDYKSSNPSSTLVYTFTPGDRIRFISNPGGSQFTELIDVAVQGFQNGGIVIYNNYKIPALQNGVLFEVYTPRLKNSAEIFYEVSENFDIGNPLTAQRYHKGGTQDQDQNGYTFNGITLVSATPAQGVFSTGDAYYRFRTMYFVDSLGATVAANQVIDDASVTDFVISNFSDIGRPNAVNIDFKEVRRPTTIYYSERFIPETNINGLGSFFDTNFESFERRYGSIQKLYAKNFRLLCLQELKCGLIPVNQQFINDNAGQKVLGTSSKVLNDIQYYSAEYGIGENPESFSVYGNLSFGIDVQRGVAWQLAEDGITPISQYKMNNYFSDKCRALLSTNSRFNVFGWYDMKFAEVGFAFETIVDRRGRVLLAGETLAYNVNINRWSTFYSFLPEFMVTNNVGIASFKAGAFYTHNTNALQNNFYGVQYNSEVHTVANVGPSNEKIFNAMSTESTDVWSVPSMTTPSGQDTSLLTTDFTFQEDVWYSPIFFDKNSGVPNPEIEGDPMRGATMLVKLRRAATNFGKIFAVNVLNETSERSNR